jgi:hypothetical protein
MAKWDKVLEKSLLQQVALVALAVKRRPDFSNPARLRRRLIAS